jgi:tRNA threonylcarbamoyladenosine biosynthesis protein TsaB
MAAAKGMAMAAGLPLLAVPTLDGLAAQVPPVDLPLCCLLDARKQQVYAALYRPEEGCYRRDSRFLVLRPEEIAQHIHEPTLIVGPGLHACQTHLMAHPLARVTSAGFLHPRAAMIGFCGGQLLARGTSDGGGEIVPLYVRASEAELNLRRMNGEMQGTL